MAKGREFAEDASIADQDVIQNIACCRNIAGPGQSHVFDIGGKPTGAGNPTWLETHEKPTRSSPIIDELIGAGATLVERGQTTCNAANGYDSFT